MYYFEDEQTHAHRRQLPIKTIDKTADPQDLWEKASTERAKNKLRVFNDNWKSRAFRQEIMRRLER